MVSSRGLGDVYKRQLWDMDTVVITPHTANIPRFMERRVGALAVKNWEKFASGEQMHTEVDVDAGY